MAQTFEAWLKAKGIDPKDLGKSHRALWRAEFDRALLFRYPEIPVNSDEFIAGIKTEGVKDGTA